MKKTQKIFCNILISGLLCIWTSTGMALTQKQPTVENKAALGVVLAENKQQKQPIKPKIADDQKKLKPQQVTKNKKSQNKVLRDQEKARKARFEAEKSARLAEKKAAAAEKYAREAEMKEAAAANKKIAAARSTGQEAKKAAEQAKKQARLARKMAKNADKNAMKAKQQAKKAVKNQKKADAAVRNIEKKGNRKLIDKARKEQRLAKEAVQKAEQEAQAAKAAAIKANAAAKNAAIEAKKAQKKAAAKQDKKLTLKQLKKILIPRLLDGIKYQADVLKKLLAEWEAEKRPEQKAVLEKKIQGALLEAANLYRRLLELGYPGKKELDAILKLLEPYPSFQELPEAKDIYREGAFLGEESKKSPYDIYEGSLGSPVPIYKGEEFKKPEDLYIYKNGVHRGLPANPDFDQKRLEDIRRQLQQQSPTPPPPGP